MSAASRFDTQGSRLSYIANVRALARVEMAQVCEHGHDDCSVTNGGACSVQVLYAAAHEGLTVCPICACLGEGINTP